MRQISTTTVAALAGGVALAVACSPARANPQVGEAPNSGQVATGGNQPNQKEFALLPVGLNEKGECVLLTDTPDLIRTTYSGRAEWIIVGNCGDRDTIAINRQFRRGEDEVDIILDGELQAPAWNSRRLVITRLRGAAALPRETGIVEFKYQVLINGKPAHYNPESNWGTFQVCPEWPCGPPSR